jgi:hypothetical protein
VPTGTPAISSRLANVCRNWCGCPSTPANLKTLGIPAYSQRMDSSVCPSATKSPRGFAAIGLFLLFGAVMASLAGVTLVWRGTALDRMWTLNPLAFRELAPHGRAIGIPFLLLGITLAVAGIGWLKYRLWGWRLAVGIIAMQVLGDLVNLFSGRVVEGGLGVAIAGALLLYLLSANVKAVFASRKHAE